MSVQNGVLFSYSGLFIVAYSSIGAREERKRREVEERRNQERVFDAGFVEQLIVS